jgi:hypothetical protein
VRVQTEGNDLYAMISGVPDGYGKPLNALLDAGDLAYNGASKLNADAKWQYSWYLFLPLGMALENRKSIELLHFPPDYSLTQAQDYLRSATTDRWATLLTDNGILAEQTPGYQTIIDIAPITAPASAGKGASLPMVAFGAPVRNWIKQQYGINVPVLGLGSISPSEGRKVAVLAANHPSYIWYAADKANYGGDETKADVGD